MKTNMQWLRLYSEARSDAKLRSLSDGQHRVWFNLLCFASEQPERGVICCDDEDILALEVSNGDVALLRDTVTRLTKLRIISMLDDGVSIAFAHWDARQYDKPSDQPPRVAARVAAYRARHRNADVTPSNAIEKSRVEKSRVEKSRVDAADAADAHVTPQRADPPSTTPKPPTGSVGGSSSGSSGGVLPIAPESFCEQTALQAGLVVSRAPNRVLLAQVLAPYHALDPDRVLVEAAKARAWFGEHERQLDIRGLDNWLRREFARDVMAGEAFMAADEQEHGGEDSHNGRPQRVGRSGTRPVEHGADATPPPAPSASARHNGARATWRPQRRPGQPDPTAHGIYAQWIDRTDPDDSEPGVVGGDEPQAVGPAAGSGGSGPRGI